MITHYEASSNGEHCGHHHDTFEAAFEAHATQVGGKADFIEQIFTAEAGDRVWFSWASELQGTVQCYTGDDLILVKWDRCTAYGTYVNQKASTTLFV